MHRVDAFGNSPGVCRKLVESIGSLLGWRNGVRQKKIETRRKIIEGSRKACREIGKPVGIAKGDRRKEDRRTYRKIVGVCWKFGRRAVAFGG
ncbi:hypothetical protein GW17_00057080 [Ensete ventricosum]|nr:hypothetical protein GW17_00057080 [Ensete ventricosum]